jgi:hypothetical protein
LVRKEHSAALFVVPANFFLGRLGFISLMSTESLKSETNVTGRRSVALKIPTNNNTGKMLHNLYY